MLVLQIIMVIVIIFVIRLVLKRPSNDRDWKPDVGRLPYAEINGDKLLLKNVRNTRYGNPGEAYEVVWEDRSYDLNKLKRLWFMVEPFHSKIKAIAHTFLSFEFEDGFLALSIEARQAKAERYTIIKGLLREFELIYSFGDERDLIARRTNYLEHDVHLYPLITPPNQVRDVLLRTLEIANDLTKQPRFYNSVTDNCTSRLRELANDVRPGSFPALLLADFLPGVSDEVLFDKGWIASKLPLDELRTKHNIREKAAKYIHAEDFSKQIREDIEHYTVEN